MNVRDEFEKSCGFKFALVSNDDGRIIDILPSRKDAELMARIAKGNFRVEPGPWSDSDIGTFLSRRTYL